MMGPAVQYPPWRQLVEEHDEVCKDDQSHRVPLLNAGKELFRDAEHPHEDAEIAIILTIVQGGIHTRQVINGGFVCVVLGVSGAKRILTKLAQISNWIRINRVVRGEEFAGLLCADFEQLRKGPTPQRVQAEHEKRKVPFAIYKPFRGLSAWLFEVQKIARSWTLGKLVDAGQHRENVECVVAFVSDLRDLGGGHGEALVPVALGFRPVELVSGAPEASKVHGGYCESAMQNKGVREADLGHSDAPEHMDVVHCRHGVCNGRCG